MPWCQFDDHLPDSEGALLAGIEALGLHLVTTCWAAAHLTDGLVPAIVVKRLLAGCRDEHGPELVARLIEAGLWQRNGDGDVQLLDFLESNRSRAQVEADRERKREAGRRGGEANARRYSRATPGQAEEAEDGDYLEGY